MKKSLLVIFITMFSVSAYATEPTSYVGKLYQENCMMCHGVYGNGKGAIAESLSPKPRDFTSYKSMSHLIGDAEQIQEVIRNGSRGTAMPAFGNPALVGDPLTKKEIVALSEYVQAFLAEEQFKIEMCVDDVVEFDTMVQEEYTVSTSSKTLSVEKRASKVKITARNANKLSLYMTKKPTRAVRTSSKIKQGDKIPVLLIVRFNYPCPKYLKGNAKITKVF